MLADVRAIAAQAGQRILDYYDQDLPVDYKADDSPLTHADRASHAYIVEALQALTPDIPVLSEESPEDEIAGRKGWSTFWLVDPLDGTKEFVKKTTGEFTVNIALIDGTDPVMGVVHVPVKGVTYFADETGAFKQEGEAEPQSIQARPAASDALTVVASRDHAGAEVAAILDRLGGAGYAVTSASMGSSLKFCLVAEGKADFYPRTVPTFEWDTAAAQAIVEAAGGRIATRDGERLVYNKDDIRNPSVFAVGDPALDWQRFVEQEVPS
ncbi:MAG: 3'(2'),5'-bisphosphate nucleotidase CysQ [Bacteroidota bacterium]